jgi:Outer membrane lipoprotein-sorting protein
MQVRTGAAALAAAVIAIALGWGGDAAGAPQHETPMSGRDIYARVLDNRFRAFTQESSLMSGDRSGRVQETRLRMSFKDFRDEQEHPVRGIVSKAIVQYTYPFDLRHTGYLIIQNFGRLDDQFVYLPARRRTVRVNLRGEAVFGTDFSFEDVIPRELEDATYRRLPDETWQGAPVYVVEATPTASYDSEYSKFVFYVDRQRFVPLRTRYWDGAGVEVKELIAPPEQVRDFDGVYVPMLMTMRNLMLESYTTLHITKLIPNPDLPEGTFEIRRLESESH